MTYIIQITYNTCNTCNIQSKYLYIYSVQLKVTTA